MLRERAQQIANELEYHGRPLSKVHRAIELMEASEQDLRDLRYQDAARKRKEAIEAMRAGGNTASIMPSACPCKKPAISRPKCASRSAAAASRPFPKVMKISSVPITKR